MTTKQKPPRSTKPNPPRYVKREKPTREMPPPPPVTMNDCPGDNQHEKTKFIRQNFHEWIEYGREHMLTGPQMAQLINMPYPTWSGNANRYLTQPEKYHQPPHPAMAAPTATNSDAPDDDHAPSPPEWGDTFTEWEQYRRKNRLSTATMSELAGIDRTIYQQRLDQLRQQQTDTQHAQTISATIEQLHASIQKLREHGVRVHVEVTL